MMAHLVSLCTILLTVVKCVGVWTRLAGFSLLS
jgi:hypothetical protein